MRKGKSAVVAAAFVALSGVACGGDDGAEAASSENGGGGGGSVTLTAQDFAWDPGSPTISAGDSIELVNEDDAKHNLTIEDAGVDEDVEGGSSVTVDLAGLEPGSYDFVCEYHADSMTGTLEVE